VKLHRLFVLAVLVVLIAASVIVAIATAWAFTITLPAKMRAKAELVVDEVGTVLFGSTPGKVEVTNLPSISSSGQRVVKDATGALIGRVNREDQDGSLFVVRDVGGVQVEIGVTQYGFVSPGNVTLLYESADCTGNEWFPSPLPQAGFFPAALVFGQKLVFQAGPLVQTLIIYRSFAVVRDASTCQSQNGTVLDVGPPAVCCISWTSSPTEVFGPAGTLDLAAFVKPLRIDVQ
jgi:hypothetical protein